MQGRNEKCHCGSGVKFKKCCLRKDSQKSNDIEYSTSSILAIIRMGLENLDAFEGGQKKVKVKNIGVMNKNTLICEFMPYSQISLDVKIEIGTIMSFFYGFLKEDEFKNVDFKYFAVRAYGQNGDEILYAISSKETAATIGKGNSIDWLKSTWFQENTPDYRLSIAKRIISEIETALREVIKDTLKSKFGDDWWDIALNNRLGQSIKKTYSDQFEEEVSSGEILINYTFLYQLPKIIVTHWTDFKCWFSNKVEFELNLDRLNKIRREEAHNRIISEKYLDELKRIHLELLSKISQAYPNIVSTFLIDNWRQRIKEIMGQGYSPLYKDIEVNGEPDPIIKLAKIIKGTKHTISYLEEIITGLRSVTVPVQKYDLHHELIDLFSKLKELNEVKLDKIMDGNILEITPVFERIQIHQGNMNSFLEKFLISES